MASRRGPWWCNGINVRASETKLLCDLRANMARASGRLTRFPARDYWTGPCTQHMCTTGVRALPPFRTHTHMHSCSAPVASQHEPPIHDPVRVTLTVSRTHTHAWGRGGQRGPPAVAVIPTVRLGSDGTGGPLTGDARRARAVP